MEKEKDIFLVNQNLKVNFLNNKEWILIGYDWNGGIKYKLNNDINGNRTRKEYYFGKMLFEGQYLNGERNGKGKEYYTMVN